jgi:hypothetical protein
LSRINPADAISKKGRKAVAEVMASVSEKVEVSPPHVPACFSIAPLNLLMLCVITPQT